MIVGTIAGVALTFGIASDESSLVTQKVSANNKSDKKEAKDKGGNVCAVSYYNFQSAISVEGLGAAASTITPGSVIVIANKTVLNIVGTTVNVDEATIDLANEDYTKSTIKATAYDGF